jgi:glycosyltransferase involved in cell wall biosynthesis
MAEINSPRVSVIVAVYNAERYLRQCLDSIINQTLREIEIICVNDGSTDNSLAILEEYALRDTRFRIFSKANEGLGGASARNLGLEKACGEFLSILDSDDFFELDMLEKAVKKADATDADIVVFGGCEYDDRNGNITKVTSILNEKYIPKKEVFSHRDCAGDIYQLSQGMAWNKLFKRIFLEKHGLKFQLIKYTDDAYFTFAHMALAEKITVLSENLCYYRVNSGVSQTDGLANYPDSAYLPYIALKNSLVEWGIYEEVERSFLNCAVGFFRYFYDKINRFEPFKYLHDKYRDEVFPLLKNNEKTKDFFYDDRLYLWTRQIIENTAETLIFTVSRAYGGENTTAILRFQFPYGSIKRDSKIVILGTGIMGRHFYSQVMLNGYCDVVMWVEKENKFKLSYIHTYEDLKSVTFDYALIAYFQENLVTDAVTFLRDIGVNDDKIIFGGTIK